MDKPCEILLFDFLSPAIAAAVLGDALFQLELHDTVHQKITKNRGLRISEAVGDISPGPDMVWKEYDVDLMLVSYSRVTGSEKTNRQAALIDVFQIQQAAAILLTGDPTLGGRVCDLLIRKCSRGYDVLDGEPYAVANIPLIINPSGARYQE
ncbi:MAG: hypothetical protein ABI539_15145 [Acidobacteriota bacterium]